MVTLSIITILIFTKVESDSRKPRADDNHALNTNGICKDYGSVKSLRLTKDHIIINCTNGAEFSITLQ